MKSASLTVLTAGVLGLASVALVNTAQASASSNAAFADEFATWQRSVSSNPAYRAATPDTVQPAADPVARPATPSERSAVFRSEEDAWQAESRSDAAPDRADVEARRGAASPPSAAQRASRFADEERTYQQLVSPNATYRGG